MGKPKTIIDEIKAETKNKIKETKKMQNSNKKSVIISVTLTLIVIGSLVGMFIFGMNYEAGRTAQVHAEAKALALSITTLKQ